MAAILMCSCAKSAPELTIGKNKVTADEAAAYLENFTVCLQTEGFDVYDVSHQYGEEEIIAVGRAESAADEVSFYMYVMDSYQSALSKAEAFTESIAPEEAVEAVAESTTAVKDGKIYVISTKGPCVYFGYAPEEYTADDILTLIGLCSQQS